MKFLHTADWQIGRQYARFAPDDGLAIAEARIATVERIARLASQEGFDAVLVAGDVFDAQTVSDRTIRRLFNATQAFRGPWIMIPGNHDAALAESVWTRAARLGAIPEHVHVALEPRPLLFAEAGFAVLPAPLSQRHTHDDLTAWFDSAQTPPDLVRIGIAHGCVQGILAEGIDSANPIAADRAASARLDYLALGDWHGARQIDERCWYSGTPEQDRFRDNGAGHFLQVEIEAPGALPQVERRPVGQFRWQQLHRSLNVNSDLEEVLEVLAQLPDNGVVAIEVEGQLDMAGAQRLREALDRAEARQRSLQCDMGQLRLLPTDDDIAALQADGYLGQVIEELRELQSGPDAETARDALVMLASLLRERQVSAQTPGRSS